MSNAHVHPIFQAILAPMAAPPVNRWREVAQAFESAHSACETCSHHAIEKDEGTEDGKWGLRTYSHCRLGIHRGDHPGMCPAINTTEESEVQP